MEPTQQPGQLKSLVKSLSMRSGRAHSRIKRTPCMSTNDDIGEFTRYRKLSHKGNVGEALMFLIHPDQMRFIHSVVNV